MRTTFFTLFIIVSTLSQILAQNPAPGNAQSKPIVLKGATIHVGNGTVIENGWIIIDDGKVTQLGNLNDMEIPDLPNAEELDVNGKHIYPGLIAMNTIIGLTEIEAVRATRDFREVGDLNPNIRSVIAYNTDSELIPTIRSNGVLAAQVVPEGGTIPGQSSVMAMDGWNWEDAAIKVDDGMHLNWPNRFSFNRRERKVEANEDYEKEVDAFRQLFKEAKAYGFKEAGHETNLKLESLLPVLEGEQTLYVHVNEALTMQQAILFCEEFDVKPVLMGANDSWKIADFLKEKEISVVLQGTQKLPSKEDEDIDQPFKTPAMLEKAGVNFVISENGSWQQRNLAFHAGQATGYGLSPEVALESITLRPAKMLGLGDRLGSLEIGKDATFIISTGDVLDMRGNNIERAFIKGKEVNLDNKQKELYRKYKDKYSGEN
ncbi:MAG: amidohydrolase family protein [Saprospiraceae bacterium]